MSTKKLVIIPAYNESACIEKTVRDIIGIMHQKLIILL